jgi:hypothetical protein
MIGDIGPGLCRFHAPPMLPLRGAKRRLNLITEKHAFQIEVSSMEATALPPVASLFASAFPLINK